MLNCEFQLCKLTSGTPLRLNPFLSHWVEGAARCADALDEVTADASGAGEAERWICVQGARLVLIKAILLEPEPEVRPPLLFTTSTLTYTLGLSGPVPTLLLCAGRTPTRAEPGQISVSTPEVDILGRTVCAHARGRGRVRKAGGTR